MQLITLDTAHLVQVLQQAQEIRIATPSIANEGAIRAIGVATSRGASSTVLLAPVADAVQDGARIMVGKDPYAKAEPQFRQLLRVKAEIFINPRFSMVGALGVQPNAGNNASYVYARGDAKHTVSLICNGPLDEQLVQSGAIKCVETDSDKVGKAVRSLHISDFDDTVDPAERNKLQRAAASELVITPGALDPLNQMLSESEGRIELHSSRLDQQAEIWPVLKKLATRLALVIPGDDDKTVKAASELGKAGASVTVSEKPIIGTYAATNRLYFVGSQQLGNTAGANVRQVGLIFPRSLAESLVPVGNRK